MKFKFKTKIIAQAEMKEQREYIHLLSLSRQNPRTKKNLESYFIRTYGCQQNESDSEQIAGILDQIGLSSVETSEEADLIIINTCSIRENADNSLRGYLGSLKKSAYEEGKIIAICGCMIPLAEHRTEILNSFPWARILFSPQDIYRLPELLNEYLRGAKHVVAASNENILAEGIAQTRLRKFRALVSIMYGCNNFCTFCIVPYTRGRVRSRQKEDVVKEIQGLVQRGYQEVMLLGQNVNAWGKDFKERLDFADLIIAIAQIEGLKRIRYMSSHPLDFSPALIEAIGKYPNIEPHVHLPLQSGSDKILRKMNRRYTAEHFYQIASSLRKARPGISITTDIIVGFPGESEADFEATLDLMRRIKFDSAFTFIYSPRPGTPAASYENQIDADTIKARFSRLLKLQEQHSLEANRALVGKTFEVMIEGKSKKDNSVLTGRLESFHLVNCYLGQASKIPAKWYNQESGFNTEAVEGKLIKVKIKKAKTYSIEAEILDNEV